jgi:DNA-directed RNA polymerase subunit beta'
MQMSSIHTGGMAGASVEAVGFQRVRQLFDLPEHMTGVVPLAHTQGTVKHIKEAPGGGHTVTIGEHEYHVPLGAPLLIKPGQSINKGDPLALGPIRPQDILKQKGIHEAQRYVVDQLKDTYKNQGADIHRKYFETVVRATTNSTNIKDAPENAPFSPGDTAPLTVVQAWNTKHPEKPMTHEPTMIGLQRLPMTRKNWMAQLGYRYAKDTIKKGASEGWGTDVQSYHPIPALAHGATFGKGKEGRY